MSAGEEYLKWFFENNIWKNMKYRGVRTLKYPPDMWNYQEILCEHKIQWIVETGTRHGGSAMYFADLLRAENASGKVVTIDPMPEVSPTFDQLENIILLREDSGSAETAAKVAALLPQGRGPMFMILDSDHRASHVARELEVLSPLLQPGDYLVVEDTIVNGNPVRPDFGPGPGEALADFLKEKNPAWQKDTAREMKFGDTFARGGYYKI